MGIGYARDDRQFVVDASGGEKTYNRPLIADWYR